MENNKFKPSENQSDGYSIYLPTYYLLILHKIISWKIYIGVVKSLEPYFIEGFEDN